MPDAEFWDAIAVLDGTIDERSLQALVDHLAGRGESAVVEFAESLASAVHALDTPAHFGQSVHDVSEDPAAPALPMSGDVFLYARLAVVARGQDAYQQVLAEPDAMSGVWQVADAEDLLSVCDHAYERATGVAWAQETSVSMETGSNAFAWGDSGLQGHGKWWSWLMTGTGWDVPDRPVYDWTLDALRRTLDTDPEWQEWWSHATAPDLELYPYLTISRAEPTRVRKGRKVVRVEHSFDGAQVKDAHRDQLPSIAVEHLRFMLELVRDRLKLPPLPHIRDVTPPDNVPDAGEPGWEPTADELRELLSTHSDLSPADVENAVRLMTEPDVQPDQRGKPA